MRSKPSKRASKGMRAVATSTIRPVRVEDDGTGAGIAEPGATETTGNDGTRPVSRRTRPYKHRKGTPTARMAVAPASAISKDQEYAFIREDLRRLLMTAGILIVVMIALLVVIGR